MCFAFHANAVRRRAQINAMRFAFYTNATHKPSKKGNIPLFLSKSNLNKLWRQSQRRQTLFFGNVRMLHKLFRQQ